MIIRRYSQLLGALASFAFITGASSAQAAIVEVTATGTVTSDNDLTGIFGPAGGVNNLIGSAIQITYRFDTKKGAIDSSPTRNTVQGGVEYGYGYYPFAPPSPSLGATVKVGSVTGPGITGSYAGEISGLNQSDNPVAWQVHLASDRNDKGNLEVAASAQSEVFNNTAVSSIPASIDTPFTYTVQPGDVSFIRAGYSVFDGSTGVSSVDTYVYGDLTSITETYVGPSPPPGAPSPTPGAGLLGLAALVLVGGLAARS